jgi:hypothetical protein
MYKYCSQKVPFYKIFFDIFTANYTMFFDKFLTF